MVVFTGPVKMKITEMMQEGSRIGIHESSHGKITGRQMGVSPKIGVFTPKMDGENNGKPYEQMG